MNRPARPQPPVSPDLGGVGRGRRLLGRHRRPSPSAYAGREPSRTGSPSGAVALHARGASTTRGSRSSRATAYVYRGTEDGDHTRDVLIATYRTRVVDGVICRVVFDRVWTNGRLSERTHDFYAQTKRGHGLVLRRAHRDPRPARPRERAARARSCRASTAPRRASS